jgi:hypothetical protein
MTSTWWILESEMTYRKVERKNTEVEEVFKAGFESVKQLLINLLGLNLMLKDEENGKLSAPGPNDFLPMTMFVGRPEILASMYEKFEQFKAQKEAEFSVRAEDKTEFEDLEFLDNIEKEFGTFGKSDKQLVWESKEVQGVVKQLVVEGEPPFIEEELEKTSRKKRAVFIDVEDE